MSLWLRALSSGGSVTSPPLSPALPKYKLADYRYGREEMLALFLKDNKVPSDLLDKEFLPILQEEPLPPLALVPFTEEEQINFSMSVNSAAVMRLTGRGGGTVAEGEEKVVSTKEVLMKLRVDLAVEGAERCTDLKAGKKGVTGDLKNRGEKSQMQLTESSNHLFLNAFSDPPKLIVST
uniref:Uncharacterized protein n=1 Tax=Sphaerodactylus townsendi TaxID=933632 RepID=A0ACB8FA63_9SAUR